jgi:hypothetical protein
MKQGYRWRKGDQIPTRVTTRTEIMSSPHFSRGVADVRAGRGMHKDFDQWRTNDQWSYERGRCWARLAPRYVVLKHNGKITGEARKYYSDDIR